MHNIQRKLLDLASDCNLGVLSLREIGKRIGEKFPQKIKYHLILLEQKGLIAIDREKKIIKRIGKDTAQNSRILSIPILGTANCGSATAFADENIEGYLRISSSLIKKKDKLFCIKASGDSMNDANIDGKSIEDGDFVIIDGENREPESGDYVLSIIDDCANIKRFARDKVNDCFVLLSESKQDYPPVFIDKKDLDSYMINGIVIKVIKKPVIN
jgi:repressor LexA